MTKCYECSILNCKNPIDNEGGIRESICPDGYHGKVVCQNYQDCESRKICLHGLPHDPFTIKSKFDISSSNCKDRGIICDGVNYHTQRTWLPIR